LLVCTVAVASGALLFQTGNLAVHADPENPLDDDDRDGLPNSVESTITHTDPLRSDTDYDGMGDGLEVGLGSDPLDRRDVTPIRTATKLLVWTDPTSVRFLFVFISPSQFRNVERLRPVLVVNEPHPTPIELIEIFPCVGFHYVDPDLTTGSWLVSFPRADVTRWSLASLFRDSGHTAFDTQVITKRDNGRLFYRSWFYPVSPGHFLGLMTRIEEDTGGGLGLGDDKDCEQVLETLEGPVKIVVDEGCVPRSEAACVSDCGVQIGRIVILLDEAWLGGGG
jgi:hypothetical protein